jgi:hypothetical protein
MTTLRWTITWTSEVDPDWYEPGTTSEEMARIEQAADIVDATLTGSDKPDFSFKVEVIKP